MDELIRVTRGVWRPADAVDDLPGRCAALLTASPDGTVVAGWAAAELHRLWLPSGSDDRIELILRRDAEVPRRHAGSRRCELRGRRRVLHPDEVGSVCGLPVTSPPRTWLDLAERLVMADLVALGDCVLRCGHGTGELARVLGRARHRRGVVKARAALPLLNARSRSRPESHLRFALVSAGLPEPEVNRPIYANGEWLAEPDLHYADAMLAIEYNGALHAKPDRMRRDITRDVDIQHRGGWRTLTVGPDEVFKRPEQTAALVRELRRRQLRDRSR